MRGPYGNSGGHFMTGPIYVCGAEPGDILQVAIAVQRVKRTTSHSGSMIHIGGLSKVECLSTPAIQVQNISDSPFAALDPTHRSGALAANPPPPFFPTRLQAPH